MAVSQRVKYLWPRNSSLGCISKGNENICPLKALYVNILSAFFHNRQKVGITQVSIKRRMDKQIVIPSYSGILPSNRGTNYWYTQCHDEQNKPYINECILYNPTDWSSKIVLN